MTHIAYAQLEAGLDGVRGAPRDAGTLALIVARPAEDQRALLEDGDLDLELGLVGDGWSTRQHPSTPNGGPDPDAQVTVMSSRAAALVSGGSDHDRWALAGDQLFVDLDISTHNLPPGDRLGVGRAVLEVTEEPHLGCGKFARRFGVDALKLVNSAEGRELRLRGLNARVVRPGPISVGDRVRRMS